MLKKLVILCNVWFLNRTLSVVDLVRKSNQSNQNCQRKIQFKTEFIIIIFFLMTSTGYHFYHFSVEVGR